MGLNDIGLIPLILYSLHLQTVDEKKVASFQEGWMPVEWGKRFELNTPIITFSSMCRGKWEE